MIASLFSRVAVLARTDHFNHLHSCFQFEVFYVFYFFIIADVLVAVETRSLSYYCLLLPTQLLKL